MATDNKFKTTLLGGFKKSDVINGFNRLADEYETKIKTIKEEHLNHFDSLSKRYKALEGKYKMLLIRNNIYKRQLLEQNEKLKKSELSGTKQEQNIDNNSLGDINRIKSNLEYNYKKLNSDEIDEDNILKIERNRIIEEAEKLSRDLIEKTKEEAEKHIKTTRMKADRIMEKANQEVKKLYDSRLKNNRNIYKLKPNRIKHTNQKDNREVNDILKFLNDANHSIKNAKREVEELDFNH